MTETLPLTPAKIADSLASRFGVAVNALGDLVTYDRSGSEPRRPDAGAYRTLRARRPTLVHVWGVHPIGFSRFRRPRMAAAGRSSLPRTQRRGMQLDNWEYAKASSGEPFVLKEIKKSKASVPAVAKLERAMKRVQDGTTTAKESDLVRNGVYELRVDIDKRWYRLLYGRKGGKFVALMFVVKKRNDLDPAWIDTSAERLGSH